MSRDGDPGEDSDYCSGLQPDEPPPAEPSLSELAVSLTRQHAQQPKSREKVTSDAMTHDANSAYDDVQADSEYDAHVAEWPDGCPNCCRLCETRLANRCLDTEGHRWHGEFAPGDTCYCGAWYLLRRDDGTWEIQPTPSVKE